MSERYKGAMRGVLAQIERSYLEALIYPGDLDRDADGSSLTPYTPGLPRIRGKVAAVDGPTTPSLEGFMRGTGETF